MPRRNNADIARLRNIQLANQRAVNLREFRQKIKIMIKKIAIILLYGLVTATALGIIGDFLASQDEKDQLEQQINLFRTEIMEELVKYQHELIKATEENVKKHLNQISENTTVSIDGSWDHPRNGYHCLVAAIDINHNKVIDYELVIRNHSKTKMTANYYGEANGMEVHGTRLLLARLSKYKNITNIVHDQDAKVGKIIRSNPNWHEYFDQRHCEKSFKNFFSACISGNKKGIKKGSIDQLQPKLLKFLRLLQKSDYNTSFKLSQWHNTIWHFSNVHKNCIHRPYDSITNLTNKITDWYKNITDEKLSSLQNFLKKTEKYVIKVDKRYHTQYSESLHGVKQHLLPKNVAWGRTYPSRIALAVLQWNEPTSYYQLIGDRLNITPIRTEYDAMFKKFVNNKQRRTRLNVLFKKSYRANRSKIFESLLKDYDKSSGYRFTKKST